MKTEEEKKLGDRLEEVYGSLISSWMIVYSALSEDMPTDTRDRLTRARDKIKESYRLLEEDKTY